MSNRERCDAILDSFTEAQLLNIADMLQAAKNAISQAEDDAFCNSLYQAYEADPDKGHPVSLEDAARELGVTL